MSLVQNALKSQRGVWGHIVKRIAESGIAQELPPHAPRRILLLGVGSSYFSAKLSALSILREWTGKRMHLHTQVLAVSSIDLGVNVFPEKGDWVFAFSHRGKTEVTLNALRACAEVGAFTVLVSAEGVPTVPSARLFLPTSSLELCEPHTVGMTSAICAVTTLVLGTSASGFWASQAALSDPDLEKIRKTISQPPTILTGEWEGEWIARETALKLIEMARVRTSVYGSEEFFHGPHFLLSKDPSSQQAAERIWAFSSPADPRSSGLQADHRIEIKETGPFSWVPALVEAQWTVLGLALNLGRNPDG